MSRVLMVVPTYDEAANLRPLLERLRAAQPEVDVLVVDDASPDGTGELADEIAAGDPRVHVLHREGKEGLGKAYLAGFAWALERDYDVVGEMDADGSHQPEQLAVLLAAIADADLVIGSRWILGGSIVNWPLRRELLSRGGNLYTRVLLGIPVRDATSRLPPVPAYDAGADRPAHDRLVRLRLPGRPGLPQRSRPGLRVVEVPIEFVERERGESKMNARRGHRVAAPDHPLGTRRTAATRCARARASVERNRAARGALSQA